MLNYLWAGMIVIGILFGAFNGKMPEITNAALDSSKEAVTLCITMMGDITPIIVIQRVTDSLE